MGTKAGVRDMKQQQSNQNVKPHATWRAKGRIIRWLSGAAAFGAGCLWALASAAADVAPGESTAAAAPRPGDTSAPFVREAATNSSQQKVMINKSVVLETRTPYKRVSVGQPDIADVNLLGQSRILV